MSVEAYRYKYEGLTGSGNTWTVEGTIEGDIADITIHRETMRASFQQLVRGRAVFSAPGAGCAGPYTIVRYTLEKVTQ